MLAGMAYKWLRAAKEQTARKIFLAPKQFGIIVPPTSKRRKGAMLSADYIIYTLFASNFVGIAFARTLHYQFYCWYFHTLPFILWSLASMSVPLRFLVVGMVEYSFNVFPATAASSALLQLAHLVVLACIMSSGIPHILEKGKNKADWDTLRPIKCYQLHLLNGNTLIWVVVIYLMLVLVKRSCKATIV